MNRESFVTLNRTRLFTADQVVDIVERELCDTKFNSTDLLLLSHDEWKRREERKHNHEETPWTAGFINGFLTDKKWAREHLDNLRKSGRQE